MVCPTANSNNAQVHRSWRSSSSGHSHRRWCHTEARTIPAWRLGSPGDKIQDAQSSDSRSKACVPSLRLTGVTVPGLRPSHTQPGTRQTTARNLWAQTSQVVRPKNSSSRAGQGRAGHHIQWPLQPLGSTQQSQALPTQLQREMTAASSPPGLPTSPPCLPRAILSSHRAYSSCHALHMGPSCQTNKPSPGAPRLAST